MFPTTIHAPKIVSAMRQSSQFTRVNTPKLYRLLERAPTLNYAPPPDEPIEQEDDPQPMGCEGKFVTGPALYYVLEGELNVSTNDHTLSLCPGQIGGPDLFAANAASKSKAHAVTKAKAVVLTHNALTATMLGDPGLTRTLGPRFTGGGENP